MGQYVSTPAGLQYVASSTNPQSAYGSIPQLPSLSTATSDINQANLNQTGALSELGTTLGAQTAGEALQQYQLNLPGYTNMVNQASQNTENELAGILSPDVIANLQTASAERGIATGTEGSGSSNAAYLQALGLTTQQLQQQGMTNLTTQIQETPTGPLYNPQTALIDPATGLSYLTEQATLAASPDPSAAAAANLGAAQAGLGAGKGSVTTPVATTTTAGGGAYGTPAQAGTSGATTVAGAGTAGGQVLPPQFGVGATQGTGSYGTILDPQSGGLLWPNGDGTYMSEDGQTVDADGNPIGTDTGTTGYGDSGYSDPQTGEYWIDNGDGTYTSADDGSTTEDPENYDYEVSSDSGGSGDDSGGGYSYYDYGD